MENKVLYFPYRERTDSKEYVVETIKRALDNKIIGIVDLVEIWAHFVRGFRK